MVEMWSVQRHPHNESRKVVVLLATEDWLRAGGKLDAWLFDNAISLLECGVWGEAGLPPTWGNPEDLRCILVLPGSVVTSTNITLPKNYLRRHRQALPVMFEDILLGEHQEQHAAVGRSRLDGSVDVAIIAKTLFADILQKAATQGLHLEAVYSDAGLLPAEDEGLTLLALNRHVLFRSGHRQVALPVGSELLSELLSKETGKHVLALVSRGAPMGWAAAFPNVKVAELPGSAEQYLAERAAGENGAAINLLQQEFKPIEGGPRTSLAAWCVAGLCASLVVIAVYLGVMASVIEIQTTNQRRATIAEVQAVIPGFRPSRDIRGQVLQYLQDKLEARDTGINFSEFISLFSLAWQQAGLEEPLVKNLRFSRPDAEVQLDIDGIAVPEVERLQVALRQEGLAPSVVSVNTSQSLPEKSLLRLRISVANP